MRNSLGAVPVPRMPLISFARKAALRQMAANLEAPVRGSAIGPAAGTNLKYGDVPLSVIDDWWGANLPKYRLADWYQSIIAWSMSSSEGSDERMPSIAVSSSVGEGPAGSVALTLWGLTRTLVSALRKSGLSKSLEG